LVYEEKLAARIRAGRSGVRQVAEKKMFGGLSFLHRGNMFCGMVGDVLIVRVGQEEIALV
jgi:TfoX/Sxy family transcriptional regulator of competence genes